MEFHLYLSGDLVLQTVVVVLAGMTANRRRR
jgi:hypothetical protein